MIHRTRAADFYGAPIGILMLDAVEPYIPGDVGNASTFSFPVRYRRVAGCTIDRVVRVGDPETEAPLVAAARDLASQGAQAISSNCGFMLRYQRAVASSVNVPVLLSSLAQLPLITAAIGDRAAVGVITASAESLRRELIEEAGIADQDRIVISGMDNSSHFNEAFMAQGGELDSDVLERETVQVARDLVSANPGVRALLLECAVLPPYAAAVQRATGLPVFDFITLITYWHQALFRRRYEGYY